ncbi:hypothetical protein GCM10010402_16290 [Actinomadura luteofluorescens]|uniref:hypothetical protein n=1 Tax=Actinomadura luteofluorescens TaxID=46163 RepID=UPI0021641638|nr:hypothetical protein [Actinomadura glauciflava]MCR3739956.1 hypothetical protein [Actinomadura glauciflava]
MAPNFTPADMRHLLNDQRRRAAEAEQQQWVQAGVVKPADVHRLTRLIAVLANGWMSFEKERQARRLIRQIQERLHQIARVCEEGDPILGLGSRWVGLLGYDRPRKGRPGFRELMGPNCRTGLALARETKSLLAAKCPDMVEDTPQGEAEAVGVQPADLGMLVALMLLLQKATASPDSAREQEIQRLVSRIWRRLQAIAANEGDDSEFQDVVDQWRKFYQLDQPLDERIGIRILVETEGDFAVALAQATHLILGLKRPDGAHGALLENLFG